MKKPRTVLIIAGGRDYKWTKADDDWLDFIDIRPSIVLTGNSGEADHWANVWAQRRGIPLGRFDANWAYHGHSAGPIRNQAMVGLATHLAAFPGGAGTADVVAKARKAGLMVYERKL